MTDQRMTKDQLEAALMRWLESSRERTEIDVAFRAGWDARAEFEEIERLKAEIRALDQANGQAVREIERLQHRIKAIALGRSDMDASDAEAIKRLVALAAGAAIEPKATPEPWICGTCGAQNADRGKLGVGKCHAVKSAAEPSAVLTEAEIAAAMNDPIVTEHLIQAIDVNVALSKMSAEKLVDVALEHVNGLSPHEQLCSRIDAKWSERVPAQTPAAYALKSGDGP